MKKIIFTILLASISFFSIGQINGGFFYSIDEYGNWYLFFKGTNTSEHQISFKIKSINENLNQEKNWNCELAPEKYFTVGPEDNWAWQPGEKLVVTYPDGSSCYWTCVHKNDNPRMNTVLSSGASHFNSPQPRKCSCCRGTGINPIASTVAAFGSTEEHWCSTCQMWVPATHGVHLPCKCCNGKGYH